VIFRRPKKRSGQKDIAPDEIFLDSSNLPEFDKHQFEGHIEKPISRRKVLGIGIFFALAGCLLLSKVEDLQVHDGNKYRLVSQNNSLHDELVFAERGAITDVNGKMLAWNTIDPNQSDYSLRQYIDMPGLDNILGYVKYPQKDKFGFYYNTQFSGADGVEKFYNDVLTGDNGLKITESDALGNVVSESTVRPAKKGENVALSIDAGVQNELYNVIEEYAKSSGFHGGAGVIMDVHTGQVLASVSYPEYDSNVLTSGQDVSAINGYLTNPDNPFLDRVSSGLYTPGSIIKPVFALGALAENIISPDKQILSTGELKVANPYQPGQFSIFKDWKANGWTDMRHAIAVSSDVYFYEIGGGTPDQKGLGIANIDKYANMFGYGNAIEDNFFTGKKGVVPTPEWKAANFNGDIWRLGDTYHTAIGQYGFQVTPIQVARAIGAVANNGMLLSPTVLSTQSKADLLSKGLITDDANPVPKPDTDVNDPFSDDDTATDTPSATSTALKAVADLLGDGSATDTVPDPGSITHQVPITNPDWYQVVREGMRLTVTEGTMKVLDLPYVQIAGKTGTAQLGVSKENINSWSVGFFPYEHPKYVFAVMLESGPSTATLGATAAMAKWFDWVHVYAPQYLQDDQAIGQEASTTAQ